MEHAFPFTEINTRSIRDDGHLGTSIVGWLRGGAKRATASRKCPLWHTGRRDCESAPTENSVRFENAGVTITRGMMVGSTVNSVLVALFALFASRVRDRAALQAEILALRHQLAVLHKNAPPRLRLQRSDRWLWVLLSRCWSGSVPSSVVKRYESTCTTGCEPGQRPRPTLLSSGDKPIQKRRSPGANFGRFRCEPLEHSVGGAEPSSRAAGQHANKRSRSERGVT